ncbi:MAG: hypothetical protein D3925_01380 [Candidatus Electrothrix sp. AR5]|nr:hypothetical protein [Candidatus Electrothrix sp. AR5]
MSYRNPPANTKWQKGQSGNPSGRKPYKHIRGAICEMFSATAINKQDNTIDDKCNLDILINNLLLKSVKGDIKSTELLFSYGYGKPNNMVENEPSQEQSDPVPDGILSDSVVLSWEDGTKYRQLFQCFMDEYNPQGITETSLVQELAEIVWKKRRLKLAERACYQGKLANKDDLVFDKRMEHAVYPNEFNRKMSMAEVLLKSEEERAVEVEVCQKEVAELKAILEALPKCKSYETARNMLDEKVHDACDKYREEDLDFAEDDEELQEYLNGYEVVKDFIKDKMLPFLEEQIEVLSAYPAITEYATSQTYSPNKTLEQIAKQETILDKKFQSILSTLLKLQRDRRV